MEKRKFLSRFKFDNGLVIKNHIVMSPMTTRLVFIMA